MKRTPDVLDVGNQLIDFRLRLRIKRQRDRSGEQAGEDGNEKLAHEIDVSVWSRCSEQPLDRQPAYHPCFDAFHEVGVGLGVVAHFLVTLARHPDEAIAIEFDAIRVPARSRSVSSGRRLASAGQSKSTPISVFSLLERGSRL